MVLMPETLLGTTSLRTSALRERETERKREREEEKRISKILLQVFL